MGLMVNLEMKKVDKNYSPSFSGEYEKCSKKSGKIWEKGASRLLYCCEREKCEHDCEGGYVNE
jgi:hypothetical protein